MEFISIILCSAFVASAMAQLPEGCQCPHRCVCNVATRRIDCTNANLAFIPTEINSCSWPGIDRVDLSNNKIRLVHEFAFSSLGNITHLFLYDNLITEIDRSSFTGLHSLEYLYLDGNYLTRLPYTVFWPLTRLRRLLLYRNILTSLPLHIFRYQRQLTLLSLSDNSLNHLNTLIFNDIPQLEQLYLHNNRITDLSHAPFRALRHLSTLYLNGNRLTTLTRFDFLGLNRLRRLFLNDNQINRLEDETFKPTLKLQYLYLQRNRITMINVLHFAGPVELLELFIDSNVITTISNGAFYRLRKLQKLILNSNQVEQITTQTFVGLDALRELHLTNNRIKYIVNDTFVQCPELQQLRLGNNELTCLEGHSFKGLSKLLVLHLGDNQLSYLPEELFMHTPNLLYLFLYSNGLRSIENRCLRKLSNLVQLSIYGNSIEYMAEGNLEGMDDLFYLEWDDPSTQVGRLSCDCSALWLHQWLAGHSVQTSIICDGPREFAGRDIRSLTPASFGCVANKLKVSINPTCTEYVVPSGGCLRLSCSSMPRGPVQWSRIDGKPLRTAPESCVFSSSCANGSRGDAILVVEEMGAEDAGYYVCSATFQNQTISDVCRVVVGAAPVVTDSTLNVELPHPGGVAKLSLNFTGNPQPTVTWERLNQAESSSGPGVAGNSRFVVSTDGDLLIMDTELGDGGLYQATVGNGAGEVKVNVSLSFRSSSTCGGPCENNGTCRTVTKCHCPLHYGGDYCQEYIGHPVTTATTTPPYLTPDTSHTWPTEPSVSEATSFASSRTPLADSNETPTSTTGAQESTESYKTTSTFVHSTNTLVPNSGSGSGSGSGSHLDSRSSSGDGSDNSRMTRKCNTNDFVLDSGSGSGSGSNPDSRSSSGDVSDSTMVARKCDTTGLEDDEDYNEKDNQRGRPTLRVKRNMGEKKWRRLEKQLKSLESKGDDSLHLKSNSKPKVHRLSTGKHATVKQKVLQRSMEP